MFEKQNFINTWLWLMVAGCWAQSSRPKLVFRMANASMIIAFAAEEHEKRSKLWMLVCFPHLSVSFSLSSGLFFYFGYVFMPIKASSRFLAVCLLPLCKQPPRSVATHCYGVFSSKSSLRGLGLDLRHPRCMGRLSCAASQHEFSRACRRQHSSGETEEGGEPSTQWGSFKVCQSL